MTAREALERAITKAFAYTNDPKKPGDVIQKMSKQDREALEKLSSNETRDTRIK